MGIAADALEDYRGPTAIENAEFHFRVPGRSTPQ